MLIGSIVTWPGPLNTIPNGWKLCNGEYLLASRYPMLLDVLQDYWGPYAGSGATQSFKLPDLRGMFLRGVNEERNDIYADPNMNNRQSTKGVSNEVGSYQQDAIQTHVHQVGKSATDKRADSQLDRPRFADFANEDQATVHQTGEPLTNPRVPGVTVKVAKESRPKNAYINFVIRVE